MFYLILTILTSVITALLFKVLDHRKAEIFPVLFINYIVALGVSIFSIETVTTGGRPLLFTGMALILGIIFVSTYTLMHKVMAKLGVGLTVSLSRLSSVLPTLGSLFIFHEQLRPMQIPGIILAFIALPFAAQELPNRENWRKLLHGGMGWGIILFIVFGVNDFTFKIKSELLGGADGNFFLVLVFSISLAISLAVILIRKMKVTKESIVLGLLLGAVNSRCAYYMIKTMEKLPGAMVYPVLGVSVIILTSTLSALIWKERIRKHNWIFLVMALTAVWLIN